MADKIMSAILIINPQKYYFFSANALYTTPAHKAPKIGIVMNSHNCGMYSPPAKIACEILRAGLTEVFVTGMLIKWIKVSIRPIAIGAKP